MTSVTENSVSLHWATPKTDNGSPITGYVIEKRDPKRQSYIQVGRTSADKFDFTVPRLVQGNSYNFQVMAENEMGLGIPAELSQGITAKSPYSKSLLHNHG